MTIAEQEAKAAEYPHVRRDYHVHVAPVTVTANANHAGVTRYAGFSVRESAATAAAATVNLRHGTATGQIIAVLELAANASDAAALPLPVQTPDGVYVEVVAGVIEGVLLDRRGV